MIALLFLIACGGGGPVPSDCADDDADCRRQAVLDAWARDREGLAARLAAVKDPIEQVALVQALSEAYPGQTAPLCGLLPEGPGKERCVRINNRPHLRAGGGQVTAPVGGPPRDPSAEALDGPGMTLLVQTDPSASLPLPWTGPTQDPSDCPDALLARACRTDAAIARARDGDWPGAAALCAGEDPGNWRWECYFQAAEAGADAWPPPLGQSGVDAVRGPFQLCLGTGEYQANCLAHVAMSVADRAPASNDGRETTWDAVKDGVTAAQEALSGLDAGLGDRVVARIWSEALRVSYDRALHLSGDPIDALPAEVGPHIRAAAAWRLFALEGGQRRDLATWGARLEQVLALRFRSRSGNGLAASRGTPIGTLWLSWLPGEKELPTALYLGQARRAVAEDPAADGLVCLLEAAARQTLPDWDLLVEGLDHPDPTVRWTAARLIQARDARGQLLPKLRASKDPRVAAQAERPPPPANYAP